LFSGARVRETVSGEKGPEDGGPRLFFEKRPQGQSSGKNRTVGVDDQGLLGRRTVPYGGRGGGKVAGAPVGDLFRAC